MAGLIYHHLDSGKMGEDDPSFSFIFTRSTRNCLNRRGKVKLLIRNLHFGWLGILEFAPPEVSGSIPSGANFGGLSPYRACSGFKRGPRKWAVGLVPSD
ncbi:hypothetical protein MTR_5g035970 [Medicago truncatula]|uniref:Uncharacterized protein n=1 Tax=Medicago truncatula TaxID=3880 RepID=G7K5I1_MEDTR|nr:hypothetical protein MTR_5g035970 [Medicago truncatula]